MTASSASDFDFFFGHWQVRHRRLKHRLAGSSEWEEFGGLCDCRPTLGGAGNVDDNILKLPAGDYRAMTIRSFDPASGQWSIWWLDSRSPGQLDVPVVGGFSEGVGTFLAKDTFAGMPILVRFQWQAGEAPTWRQAFSADDGTTWEENWTMQFERLAESGLS